MLQRRLQIRIDDARHRRLRARADDLGVSIATVVRGLIDTELPASNDQRSTAARLVLAADPMRVPTNPAALRRDLDASRDRH